MSKPDAAYAVQVMLIYGDSFIQSLAETWVRADEANRQRIEQAFEAEFRHYDDMFKEAA